MSIFMAIARLDFLKLKKVEYKKQPPNSKYLGVVLILANFVAKY